MRQMKTIIVLGLLGMVFAAPASADWFFGAKAGPMMIDTSGISDTKNAGVVVGYDLGVAVGDLALEGEITKTVSSGDFIGLDVDVDTQALYLAFRTAGPMYFKVKGGYLNEDVSIGSVSASDSGMSYGVGVGFGVGVAQLELELTIIEQDINFLSVGVQF